METTLTVNGKTWTATKMSDKSIQLVGPRGARAWMDKNIHSGAWMLTERGGRVSCVETVA